MFLCSTFNWVYIKAYIHGMVIFDIIFQLSEIFRT